MDLIEPILSSALKLYSQCEKVKANKKQCKRLKQRVEELEKHVRAIQREGAVKISDIVKNALRDLDSTLHDAGDFMEKHNNDNFLIHMLKANNFGDKFDALNNRLSEAYQLLSGALQVDDHHELFEESSRRAQDAADRKEDHAELLDLVQLMGEKLDAGAEKLDAVLVKQDSGAEKLDAVLVKQDAIQQMLENQNKPKFYHDIREIKPDELSYDIPKKPFRETGTSVVFKGEYKKATVAIKRYSCQSATTPSEVRSIFNKEIQTMRHFESPNILRMYGICIQDEKETNPYFHIVMEYCEKGSLREVLDSQSKLPWVKQARMCLGAAQGIYTLHTGEKPKLHGSISSDNFLVAGGCIVKLGGLELAQTETSLRKNVKDLRYRSLRYRSPEQLGDLNHAHCMKCEIYSLGIVLWEIATRKNPLNDCSIPKEILDRVWKKKLVEPLPEDCPKQLGEVINACRAFDSHDRPTARELVEKLQRVKEQLAAARP